MAQMDAAELEHFQNLSDRYQADLPGPLIGDRLPMDVLVTEYAQADPTFVVKTTGLAATHSAYRAVKGDGQCGWRATVFSYFEILLNSRDIDLVESEKIRFDTFQDTMKMVGIDYDIIIDMFDYTWELFDNVAKAIRNNIWDDNVILEFMNDQIKSDSIVYHFKMVTSAYMQLRADDYEPFLEMTVAEYRVARIDPTNQEIDQIGLQVLTDAVIDAAGFALEVLYLDRSMGEEVTPHQFVQLSNGKPTIRLLYRPGHYDIIYRDTQPTQVYLQNQQMIPQQMEDRQSHNNTYDFLFHPGVSQSHDQIYYQSMYYPPSHHYQHYAQSQYMWNPSPSPYQAMHHHQPPPPPPPPMQQPSARPLPNMMPVDTLSRQLSPLNLRHSPVSSSPTSTSLSLNEPQIRFTPHVYNMPPNFESVPLTLNPGR